MATSKKHKARESTVSKDETAEQRFTRLATARVSAAIKRLRLIKNLAGTSYVSTPEQRTKIMEALQTEIDALHTAFAEKIDKTDTVFVL
jgi:hypothetical protein